MINLCRGCQLREVVDICTCDTCIPNIREPAASRRRLDAGYGCGHALESGLSQLGHSASPQAGVDEVDVLLAHVSSPGLELGVTTGRL